MAYYLDVLVRLAPLLKCNKAKGYGAVISQRSQSVRMKFGILWRPVGLLLSRSRPC